jgi:hypothetical protein
MHVSEEYIPSVCRVEYGRTTYRQICLQVHVVVNLITSFVSSSGDTVCDGRMKMV